MWVMRTMPTILPTNWPATRTVRVDAWPPESCPRCGATVTVVLSRAWCDRPYGSKACGAFIVPRSIGHGGERD